MSEDQTHFGYQKIRSDLKTEKVSALFEQVAPYYDHMNDFMSFGLHRLWKKTAVARCSIQEHHCVLDLAAGTGDLTQQITKRLGADGRVVMSDINQKMLHKGIERLLDQGITQRVSTVQADAEKLPFSTHCFDRITMAFGLRNTTHLEKALSEIYRVLKKGGRAVILEFSTPQNAAINHLYSMYSFKVIPKLGQWLYRDTESYNYLVESIRQHPDQETLKNYFLRAGFERCEYQNLNAGIVAIHIGYKN